MAFTKINPNSNTRPPRHWVLKGWPHTGKSRFASQLKAPLLPIDLDGRWDEVKGFVKGDQFGVNASHTDITNVSELEQILSQNMPDSGVKSIIVDSVTRIFAVHNTRALLANQQGDNKNHAAAHQAKALNMRLLQEAVARWNGVDFLLIWHYEQGRDAQGKQHDHETISELEVERLKRSVNIIMETIREGEGKNTRYGVRVLWARNGNSGAVIYDDSGTWAGMPEKIEAAVYDNKESNPHPAPASSHPAPAAPKPRFGGKPEALAWAVTDGAYPDVEQADKAYEDLKKEKKPKGASEMFEAWAAHVEGLKANY